MWADLLILTHTFLTCTQLISVYWRSGSKPAQVLIASSSSRCGLWCGLGGPLHGFHLRLAQHQPQQTHLPPLHHSHGHLQHPGGVPGGDGHHHQRELGGRVAAVAVTDCSVMLRSVGKWQTINLGSLCWFEPINVWRLGLKFRYWYWILRNKFLDCARHMQLKCLLFVCVCVWADRQVTVGVGIYCFFFSCLSQGSLVHTTSCFLLIHHSISSCASHTFRAPFALKAHWFAFIQLPRSRMCCVQSLRWSDQVAWTRLRSEVSTALIPRWFFDLDAGQRGCFWGHLCHLHTSLHFSASFGIF